MGCPQKRVRKDGGMTYRVQVFVCCGLILVGTIYQVKDYGWEAFFYNRSIVQAGIAGWMLCLILNGLNK